MAAKCLLTSVNTPWCESISIFMGEQGTHIFTRSPSFSSVVSSLSGEQCPTMLRTELHSDWLAESLDTAQMNVGAYSG